MDMEKYIQSLENLLIFMCDTHEAQYKALHAEMKKLGRLLDIPQIQGTSNRVGIAHIGELDFIKPEYGFQEVCEMLKRRRDKTPVQSLELEGEAIEPGIDVWVMLPDRKGYSLVVVSEMFTANGKSYIVEEGSGDEYELSDCYWGRNEVLRIIRAEETAVHDGQGGNG